MFREAGPSVTSRRHIKLFASALCILGGASGCADREVIAPATSEGPDPVNAPVDVSIDSPPPPGAEVQITPTSALSNETVPATAETAPQEVTESYTPPFPNRVDLFVAPKRQGGVAHDSTERAVELMGFVRVDKPRAILSINGQVSPVSEGESVDGIEVISVTPPSVLLQRGRQRWQATIE